MKTFWTSLIIRAAIILVLSGAAGTGFNLLYSQGLNPFRPLPPRATHLKPGSDGATPGVYTPSSDFIQITLDEAVEKFESGMAVFIDARTELEFRKGHIPGAINIPPYVFEKGRPDAMNFIPPEGIDIVLYCNNEKCPMADETARHLLQYGIMDFVIFPGGWDEWEAAGHPMEKPQ